MTPEQLLVRLKALESVDHLKVVQEGAVRATTQAAAAARRSRQGVAYRVRRQGDQVVVTMSRGAKSALTRALAAEKPRIDAALRQQINQAAK